MERDDERNPMTGEAEKSRILPLVSESGNRRILREWIEGKPRYQLVDAGKAVHSADFDICIFDVENLTDEREALRERKSRKSVMLPYILLVPENRAQSVRDQLRSQHPKLWEIIDAILEIPLSKLQLDDRIETLLRLRRQSIAYQKQRSQLEALRSVDSGHGVVITDADGTIEYINEVYQQQSGYSQDELVGETPGILKSGEHGDAFYEGLWSTITDGKVWQGEVINERKNGEQYVVVQTVAPIRGLNGEIERFVAINHEITELKEMEQAFREQSEELELLNRILRHDVRNDLNIILGWAESLEETATGEEEEKLERIRSAGQRAVELTRVARDIAEAISGEEEPELHPVPLDDVLTTEVENRTAAFDDAAIELHSSLDSEVRVRANQMLSSVFRNLINNAVKHNDAAEPEVIITTEERTDSIVVRVADNGPGVPAELKARMFGEGERGLDSQGTGMGLYLVQSLVDTYGGAVWIDDNDPRGSVFTVELPKVPDSVDQ